MSPNLNVFKVLNFIQRQETLTSHKFMRVNQGAAKKVATAQQVKDAQIDSLKKDNKHGEIEVMDYLVKISGFLVDLINNFKIYFLFAVK